MPTGDLKPMLGKMLWQSGARIRRTMAAKTMLQHQGGPLLGGSNSEPGTEALPKVSKIGDNKELLGSRTMLLVLPTGGIPRTKEG